MKGNGLFKKSVFGRLDVFLFFGRFQKNEIFQKWSGRVWGVSGTIPDLLGLIPDLFGTILDQNRLKTYIRKIGIKIPIKIPIESLTPRCGIPAPWCAPCWARALGPFICWALLGPFICWALLGPFICWALLGPFIFQKTHFSEKA